MEPRRGGVRVAMVCGEYDPARDGVSAYTERLVRALAAKKVEGRIVSSRPGSGASVSGWRLRDLPSLHRALSGLRADLVHVQFAPSAYGYRPGIGLLPWVSRGIPLVATLHEYGWWSWRPRWLPAAVATGLAGWAERRGWWDRETLRLTLAAAALIVTNDRHAWDVRQRLGRHTPPVHVVPIAPNVAARPVQGDERAEVRAALGAPRDAPLLVFFGFVHPVKGIRYLLEAAATLAARQPELRLALVGGFDSLALRDGEAAAYRREVEETIGSLGLDGRVAVTGYVDERAASRFLTAADIVVLPFTTGLSAKSGALLAALAHGTPVVGTRGEPPDPELVDGELAVLVPPRQPDQLARAVEQVLSSPVLAARLRVAGLAFAQGRTWHRIASTHAAIYRALSAG